MSLPRRTFTYCGLLDDFAMRHGDLAITTLDGLNRRLVFAVIFGDPMLINDGYVLTHPVVRHALTHPSSSPLQALIEAGYVRILTRNGGELESLAEDMAELGITSAQRLLQEPVYHDSYRPVLEKLGPRLRSDAFESFKEWPTLNVTAIFQNVSDDIYAGVADTAQGQGAEQLRRFRDAFEKTERRRTDWEDKATDLQQAEMLSTELHGTLMEIANEAYQYSWGCALHHAGEDIRVQTRLPKYLSFDRPAGEPSDLKRKPVTFYAPNIELAGGKIGKQWQRLAEMVAKGDETNVLKYEFRDTLGQYYASRNIADDEMQRKAERYSKQLAKHFRDEKPVAVTFDVGFTITSTTIGTLVGGPVGAGVGFAIGLVGNAAAHFGGPQLFTKLASLPKRKKWIVRSKELPPDAASCFELDPARIDPYVRSVAPFRPF